MLEPSAPCLKQISLAVLMGASDHVRRPAAAPDKKLWAGITCACQIGAGVNLA